MVFVSDNLQTYALEKIVRLAKDGKIENVYAVEGKSGAYVRTKPHTAKAERLEQLSVSPHQLFAWADNFQLALSTPAVASYLRLYERAMEEGGEPFIVIDGHRKITKCAAKEKLQPHKELIFEAAERFRVDSYLLGAIIIDEIARFGLFEPITDPLDGYFIGVNTSAGIAQVKTKTARGLIKNGYYNPNPHDDKLSFKHTKRISLAYLYKYVREPRHSIFFAAARMRELIDSWKRFVDLNGKPEIITTLYHLPYKEPHDNPQSNNRGVQIANEFYQLAKDWLQ